MFQKGQGADWLGQVFTMCDKYGLETSLGTFKALVPIADMNSFEGDMS